MKNAMKLFALLAAFLFAANVFASDPVLTNSDNATGNVVVKVDWQTTVLAEHASQAIWIASGTTKTILMETEGTNPVDERPLYSVNFLITGDMGLKVDLTTTRSITRNDAESTDLTVAEKWEFKNADEEWIAFTDADSYNDMKLLGGSFGDKSPLASTTNSQLRVRVYPTSVECGNTVTPGEYTIAYTLTATNSGYDSGFDTALTSIEGTYLETGMFED